jgi:hypothetical protein
MDTPIFAAVPRGTTPADETPSRSAHEAGRDGGTSVTDLLRRQHAHTRTDQGRSAGTAYVGHVPGLLSFRLGA